MWRSEAKRRRKGRNEKSGREWIDHSLTLVALPLLVGRPSLQVPSRLSSYIHSISSAHLRHVLPPPLMSPTRPLSPAPTASPPSTEGGTPARRLRCERTPAERASRPLTFVDTSSPPRHPSCPSNPTTAPPPPPPTAARPIFDRPN